MCNPERLQFYSRVHSTLLFTNHCDWKMHERKIVTEKDFDPLAKLLIRFDLRV